ncbi:MAG: peptidase M16 [Blastocatellia bacterium]
MKENIRETRFENGLTIVTDRMPGVRSVTLGFFFRAGARHEPMELHGITHFIEHTVFKGTSRRSAKQIAIELDRLGGNLDAFTSHEETGFAIKVIDNQLAKAFDLIADVLTDPLFDAADLESEQKVIIEEIKMIEDSPEEYLGEIFSEAYFASHPLGRNIAGTPESVKRFNPDRTRQYHSSIFSSANLVLTAAGSVDHREIVDLAAKYFSSQRRTATDLSQIEATPPPSTAAPIIVEQDPTLEQAHLIIATPMVAATDERRYAAELLANIIGGGISSRLWQKVREQRGLAYSVGASTICYDDCGIFSMFAATSPEQVEEVVDLSIVEMRNLVQYGVSEDELDLAKQHLAASILLSLEDSAARATALAQSELTYGRQIPIEETLARIDAVSIGELQAVAREFFKTDKVAFAALGNLKRFKINRARLRID